MLLRLNRRSALYLAGVALLIICAGSGMWLFARQRVADGWVRHTLEIQTKLSDIQVFATRAEINRRGYLLTGSSENMQTYLATRRAVLPLLHDLAVAVSDNPPQLARARQLHDAILARLDDMALSMRLYRAGRRADAIAVFSNSQSHARTARLLDLMTTMRADEQRLLAMRSSRSGLLQRLAEAALGTSSLLIVLLVIAVGWERRQRLQALAELNASLERDIEQRKALEIQLKAARVRAEESGRAKSAFLANMSHEIRTPMNGVIGFTDLLLTGDLSDVQRRQAEMIADSGRAMMRLLNDILDLSKVEAGQMKVSDDAFDLRHTLKGCAKLMGPAIEQRGIAFRREIADDLPKVIFGDGLRLRQIVLNLLGNAAKFTSAGAIAFRARTIDHAGRAMIEIEIEDSGIGIAAEHQAAIFDHFVQADNQIASRFGGTGLGLAISAQLARLMGGELRVKSELGVGSIFTLRLPYRLPAASDLVPLAIDPFAEPAAVAAAPALPRTGLHILVAEDHDVNQMLILSMLEQLGYRAELARDGAEAFAMTVQARTAGDPYALVLMDMQMPNVDGCEASLKIRASGFAPSSLPILALTANAFADDIATCLNAGMQAHLPKPIKITELDGAIRRWAPQPSAAKPVGADRFSPQLRERYAARKHELIAMIDELARSSRVSDAQATDACSLLHKFAGSAELFGDGGMGDTARKLEVALTACARGERSGHFRQAIDAIRPAAA